MALPVESPQYASDIATEVCYVNACHDLADFHTEILQTLGCIPRTPSPEPDFALMAARLEDMISNQKQQARALNLENLRLRVGTYLRS